MFKATREIASILAREFNLCTDDVWDIIKGMKYNTVEDLEMAVCKAMASA
jgi:hypothetical protein